MTIASVSKAVALATSLSLLASAPALGLESGSPAPAAQRMEATGGSSAGSKLGIFGCSADGGKQTTGAVIGGVLGGLLGNRVAGRGSRTLGTILGGAIGAAAGSALGCKLQKNDQAKAERAMEEALAKNEDQSWSSAETGASGSVKISDAAAAEAGISGISFAKGVEPASGYTKVAGAYVTKGAVNVRGTPSTQGALLGKLPTGTRVWVPASVKGQPWYLIAQNNEGKGYVSAPLMTKAATSVAANSCKTVTQTIDVPGEGPGSETFQACKGPDGSWVMTRV